MGKFEFKPPQVPGAFDPHNETPPTSGELDIADRDKRFPGQIHFDQRKAEIDAEPRTPEQLAAAHEQARLLSQRYGNGRKDAA